MARDGSLNGLWAVYALFGRNRVLLATLGTLFVAEVASLCYLLAVVTPQLKYNIECYVVSSPSIFQYYWCVLRPSSSLNEDLFPDLFDLGSSP